jgi:hypothetical protein
MIAFLDFLDKEYGGAEGYAKNVLGFSQSDLEIIKNNLLVPVASSVEK